MRSARLPAVTGQGPSPLASQRNEPALEHSVFHLSGQMRARLAPTAPARPAVASEGAPAVDGSLKGCPLLRACRVNEEAPPEHRFSGAARSPDASGADLAPRQPDGRRSVSGWVAFQETLGCGRRASGCNKTRTFSDEAKKLGLIRLVVPPFPRKVIGWPETGYTRCRWTNASVPERSPVDRSHPRGASATSAGAPSCSEVTAHMSRVQSVAHRGCNGGDIYGI